MFKAKDIMSTPAISISGEKTLKEAIDLLAEKKISGFPVVNEQNQIIGIISDTDIIAYSQKFTVVPHTTLSGWISPYASVEDLASMKKGYDLLGKTKVKEIMTKKVYTVAEETEAPDIAKLMSKRNINRIPVVNSEGKLTGIVTRANIIQCMAKY
ncbi:MAG: CBS domain-containing protein [Bacillota bacterium]